MEKRLRTTKQCSECDGFIMAGEVAVKKENKYYHISCENKNKMEKILATNDKGEGLLPMKQGKEQEAKKTEDMKNIEVCNFIKNAFCLDGDVEMVLSDKPITSKLFFRCSDSKRGKIWVAYGELKQEDGNSSQA